MSLPESTTYDQLGGTLTDNRPVENPDTDLSAHASNLLRPNTAAMSRTAIRGWFAFTVTLLPAPSPVIASSDFDAVYGNSLSVKPFIEIEDVGIYTVTFPSSIIDDLLVTRYLLIRGAVANYAPEDPTHYFDAKCKIMSANTMRIHIYDNTNTLSNPAADTDKISVMFL